MSKKIIAGALIALCFSLPAQAAKSKVKSAEKVSDPVVATVNGNKIRLSEIESVHAANPQLSSVPLGNIYEPLLDNIIDLDICGSNIAEFEGTKDHIVAERKVPLHHDEIAEYQKTRSALNHVTVMFKKAKVLQAGNYQDVPLMEDDSLWVRMILKGAKCANIDENLVYVRVDGGMFERRGGWDYFQKYRQARKKIYETGYISYWDYLKTIMIQLVVTLLPLSVRRFLFLHFLRK